MKFSTIAFMAESGHGKNFCGEWVVKNHKFLSVAFADHIKRFCKAVFKEFTNEALWGIADLRNAEVSVDWQVAESRFVWSVDDWVSRLTNLSLTERIMYKRAVSGWIPKLREMTKDGPISPRMALQLLGTEYGRHFKKDIWSSFLMTQIIPDIQTGSNYVPEIGVCGLLGSLGQPVTEGVVITDCRFGNELVEVQKWGGFVVKVIRKSLKDKENSAEASGIKNHASEVEIRSIPDEAYDLILEMDDGPEHVYPRLEKMMKEREFERRLVEGRPAWVP